MTSFQSDLGPYRMPKQVFLAYLQRMVAPFSPLKIPKCFENALFWDKKTVKNGFQIFFPTMILDHFGCLKTQNPPILGPLQAIFGPSKVVKCF